MYVVYFTWMGISRATCVYSELHVTQIMSHFHVRRSWQWFIILIGTIDKWTSTASTPWSRSFTPHWGFTWGTKPSHGQEGPHSTAPKKKYTSNIHVQWNLSFSALLTPLLSIIVSPVHVQMMNFCNTTLKYLMWVQRSPLAHREDNFSDTLLLFLLFQPSPNGIHLWMQKRCMNMVSIDLTTQ